MGRKFNIVIFGATGFTGKYLVEELVNVRKRENLNFTWAVSARSEKKLDEILKEMSLSTGENLNDTPKIIADVSKPESIREMVRNCDIVLNCVGPYILYGEVVVKACVEEGTHHMDLSGESDYLENMLLKYSRSAEENGAYIIAPCGFDSVPADVGTTYLQQQFGGDLNSVDIYLQFHHAGKGSKINFGTWHSGVIEASKFFKRGLDRRLLYPDPLPKPQFRQTQRYLHNMSLGEDGKGWFFPNPVIDEKVIHRSQRHFYHKEGRQPIQAKVYFGARNIFSTLFILIGVGLLGLIAQFKFGLGLLEKYPEFFTFGAFGREGPTREQMDNLTFTFTLIGKGWSKSRSDTIEKQSQPPNKTKILKVKGRNPAYGATNQIFLHCALVMLEEKDKMPKRGGVYTPAVAFEKTSLVDRLNNNGVTFKIVDKDE